MTEAELEAVLRRGPRLYHLTEAENLASIRRHGLLSVSALLDLFGVAGAERDAIERERRPGRVTLRDGPLGTTVIRDQGPMGEAALARCLDAGWTPQDWRQLLNRRAFLYFSMGRVERLRGARQNRGRAHLLLEFDAAGLFRAHGEAIRLCAINSGAASRNPARRGAGTFLPIPAYPYAFYRGRRAWDERIVEVTVEGGVPDAGRFLRKVRTLPARGDERWRGARGRSGGGRRGVTWREGAKRWRETGGDVTRGGEAAAAGDGG